MDQLSVFDMLKLSIGPSSSHTLGPWLAARRWVSGLKDDGLLHRVLQVELRLYGSLALTGKGHYTHIALVHGLIGHDPATYDTGKIVDVYQMVKVQKSILLGGERQLVFDPEVNIRYLKAEQLPAHANGMRFVATLDDGALVMSTFYSTGGGFIIKEGDEARQEQIDQPYPLRCASDLQKICSQRGLRISDVVMENERATRSVDEIWQRLLHLWQVMKAAAYEGCHTDGVLPGGLEVTRRAAELNKKLLRVHDYRDAESWIEAMKVGRDFKKVLTRISCLAIATNEVNASMGRIVTAPTNGSAGVLPAVLFYYICFSGQAVDDEAIVRFLLTAGEIGKFFKRGATISAAAGGCQAEIGVSSSMAAAALTEALGGSASQALMAAEIAAEHHLGLTCDPVGGLVQIPCIERNSMGAVKAVTASMIALASNPANAKVSLDAVIASMKETSEHMNHRFKETSLGGLANQISVDLPEC